MNEPGKPALRRSCRRPKHQPPQFSNVFSFPWILTRLDCYGVEFCAKLICSSTRQDGRKFFSLHCPSYSPSFFGPNRAAPARPVERGGLFARKKAVRTASNCFSLLLLSSFSVTYKSLAQSMRTGAPAYHSVVAFFIRRRRCCMVVNRIAEHG